MNLELAQNFSLLKLNTETLQNYLIVSIGCHKKILPSLNSCLIKGKWFKSHTWNFTCLIWISPIKTSNEASEVQGVTHGSLAFDEVIGRR